MSKVLVVKNTETYGTPVNIDKIFENGTYRLRFRFNIVHPCALNRVFHRCHDGLGRITVPARVVLRLGRMLRRNRRSPIPGRR